MINLKNKKNLLEIFKKFYLNSPILEALNLFIFY